MFGKKQENQIKELFKIKEDFIKSFKKCAEYKKMIESFVIEEHINKQFLQEYLYAYFSKITPNPLVEYNINLNNKEDINTLNMIFYNMDRYIIKKVFNKYIIAYEYFLVKHMIFFNEEYPSLCDVSCLLMLLGPIFGEHINIVKKIQSNNLSQQEIQQLLQNSLDYAMDEIDNHQINFEKIDISLLLKY